MSEDWYDEYVKARDESDRRWYLICKIKAYTTMDADPDRPSLTEADAMKFIREALAEFEAEGKP